MEDKKVLNFNDLENIAGGWDMEDLTAEERAEIYRLRDECLRLARLAGQDPSYQDEYNKAMDAWDNYTDYIIQIYSYKEKHGILNK